MASVPASNSEQFPSSQSTESLQPAPGLWMKAWSEHKEGEEEGKRNNYRRKEKKQQKRGILQVPAQRRLRLEQEKASRPPRNSCTATRSASPDHSGALCHSPSLQTSCSGLHLRQEILPGEEERHKQMQEELFLKAQVTDFRGAPRQADRRGPAEQPQPW